MPTASIWKAAKLLGAGLGLLACLLLHLAFLREVPGLHFDEAWAWNHAHRLSQGQWTTEAISPYTMPWVHYWAALWLKIFGDSLAVFRGSQVALSLLGLAFLALALWEAGKPKAALFFPWAVLLLPGLLINHRFAIELNGLHALCFGLLLWSLPRKNYALAAAAWVLGTTSHLLFYPVGFAFVGAWVLAGHSFSREQRRALLLALGALTAFFLRVALGVPEKGKALALLGSGFVLLLLVAARAERWPGFRSRHWKKILFLPASVFLFNAWFFSEGSWGVGISTGWFGSLLVEGSWVFPVAVILLGALPALFWALRAWRLLPAYHQFAFLLGVIGLGALMLKPAPRYFEVALLAGAILVALGWAESSSRVLKAGTFFLLLLHGLYLYPIYFFETPVEREIRFLFFKDSSRDFLSKQELLRHLGGCGLSDIKSSDSRVMESLRALARSDWPKAEGGCRWKNLGIERRAEREKTAERGSFPIAADFALPGETDGP